MSKSTILYVEDDEFSRDVMELIFDDMPEYELIVFEDSRDFEAKLKQLPKLSLVLLDIHMEPDDGFTMLKIIRQHGDYATLPVLALTASVMSEEITQLRESGFNGAIAKPIDQDFFAGSLADALAGKLVWTI